MTDTPINIKATEKLAKYSTSALVSALHIVDRLPGKDPAMKMTYTWLIKELERRYPEAAKAVEDAFYEAELEADRTGKEAEPVDYVAVLVAAIPEADRK